MRFLTSTPLSIFLSLFFLLQVNQSAKATIWVEQISGSPKAIVIARNGNFLATTEMMRLKPGDIVKVSDDNSSVRILFGSGAVKNITKAASPFTIEGSKEGSTFLSNLFGEVKKMLVASSDETEAIAMMTRGRSKQLVILGVGADENLVLAGSRPLMVGWLGGKAPYKLSLINPDSDQPILSKSDLTDQTLTIETATIGAAGLAPGEYQVLVEGGAKTPSSSEIELLVVEPSELPAQAQKLLTLGLDKRVEARLLINLLYKTPEWRFFVYNLAAHHGLEKERRALLVMK